MQNLHLKLTSKYPRYNSWHQTKHHNKIHWGVLIGFALIASLLILNSNNQINAQADTIPPLTPTNLTATAISSSQLNLSWTASTDNVAVAGYKIYRCAGSGCAPTVQIATSAVNSYSNTGLTASTAYTYAVSAYDAAGNESGKTGSVSGTTDSQTQTLQETLYPTYSFNLDLNFLGTINVRPNHPRLLITDVDLLGLRALVGISDYKNITTFRGRPIIFGQMQTTYLPMKNKVDNDLVPPQIIGNDFRGRMTDIAFVYLIEQDSKYSDAVKQWLDVLYNQGQLLGRWFYQLEQNIVLDWIYDTLTEQDKQKYFTVLAQYNTDEAGSKTITGGHYPKSIPSNLNTAMGINFVTAGLMLYGDSIFGKDGEEILARHGGFLVNFVIPSYDVPGIDGGWHEDDGHTTMASTLLFEIEHWTTATGRNLWQESEFSQYYPMFRIYGTRPDERFLTQGANNNTFVREQYGKMLLASWRNQNGYIKELAVNNPSKLTAASRAWMEIVWLDNSLAVQQKQSLPLSHLFTGIEQVIMRSGWNINNKSVPSDTFARFQSGNWYASHQHWDQGNFEIFKHAPLAVDDGKSGANTINQNTIVIDGENQVTQTQGTGLYGEDSQTDIADITVFESTADYDYTMGDITKAYNPLKLQKFARQFVYLRPDTFVIFDRVATKSPSFTKEWILNTINPPLINGNMTQINNSPGRLFVKTLLPTDVSLTTEDGVRVKRLVVKPGTGRTNDTFLHVLQATEEAVSSMTPAYKIDDAGTMVGALIDDPAVPRIVLFSKDPAGATVSSATYTADYSSTLTGKHLLADITPGTYDIYKNGARILTGITSQTGKNTLSFESTGGSTFSIVQTGVAPTYQCSDSIDNDSDGKTDYPSDTGCSSDTDNDETDPSDTTAPTTPTNLTATVISSSQINLSWTASTDDLGVTGYKIYRCTGSGCTPTTQISTSATNSYSDTGLTASTTYIYAVSAYDAAGKESGKSASVSATTQSGAQTWQQTLEQNFDIVDTFDNYNDWRGDALFSCKYQEDNVNNLPTYLDGSPGKWGKYCYYEGYDGLPPYAIKDHGTGKRVTGKSVRLSHPGNGLDKGELGLFTNFFAEKGNEFSGYNEVYTFFRMNLPHNAFPTYDSPGDSGNVAYDQINPPVVKYIDGYTYYPIASWKWFNINTGWRNAKCFSNIEECPPPNPNDCRYGNNEVHLHLKTGKSQNYQQTFQLAVHNTASKVIFWGIPGIIIFDQLVGVELYYKLESSLGANDGLFKAWVYDTSGKATLAADVGGISWRPSPGMGCYQKDRTENHKFNRIAIESNKHVSGYPFNCGTGMDCAWYLDDLIIDDQRIGTTYFSLLNNQLPPSDTTPPTAPGDLTAQAISSSQINLSWTASTDNVGVTGYKIYRCAGLTCTPTTQIGTSATNSYSDTGLTASTTYTYTVSAYDAANNESIKSSSVSAATLASFKPSDLNKDGKVDSLDFEIFKLDFNRTDKPVSDFNQDGVVDSRDLGMLMGEWTR